MRPYPLLHRALLPLIALTLSGFLSTELAAQQATIAGGPQGGFYDQLARGIADRLNRKVVVRTTHGSIENLEFLEEGLLGAGEIRFALAQQDTVAEHFRKNPGTSIRDLDRVFFDYLHIFVRRPLYLETAREFRLALISLGEPESGTRYTATRFLQSVGVPLSSIKEPDGSREDVAMLVTTAGSGAVCDIMETNRYRLFSLDYKTLRLLTEEEDEVSPNEKNGPRGDFRSQITVGSIPAGTYPGQKDPVSTIAVPVLLLVRADKKKPIVAEVRKAAEEEWEELSQRETSGGCRIPKSSPQMRPLKDSGLSPYDSFRQADVGLPELRRISGPLMAFGPPSLFLMLVFWGWRKGWHWWLQKWLLGRPLILILLTLFLLFLGVSWVTVTTYLVEHDINEHFSSIPESFWSITVYLFSGLEDRNPQRTLGRVVATVGLVLGPLAFALLTGWLARLLIRMERTMPENLKGHYLLLNWNERAVEIIRQLHHPVITKRQGKAVIVVLTDNENLNVRRLKELSNGEDKLFEDFYLRIGDPATGRALEKANVAQAKTIVVLANEALGDHADASTIRSLVMLRKIARKRNAEMHVVAELVDTANDPVVQEIAGDFPGLLERVSGSRIRTFLLAQATLNEGVTEFYRDLLSISGETNEIYTLRIPDSAVEAELDFRQYAIRVLKAQSETPIIPVGIQRRLNGRSKFYCNPHPSEPAYRLAKGDRLVVLAYQPPSPDVLPSPGDSDREL